MASSPIFHRLEGRNTSQYDLPDSIEGALSENSPDAYLDEPVSLVYGIQSSLSAHGDQAELDSKRKVPPHPEQHDLTKKANWPIWQIILAWVTGCGSHGTQSPSTTTIFYILQGHWGRTHHCMSSLANCSPHRVRHYIVSHATSNLTCGIFLLTTGDTSSRKTDKIFHPWGFQTHSKWHNVRDGSFLSH